jgi:hypothetical protein
MVINFIQSTQTTFKNVDERNVRNVTTMKVRRQNMCDVNYFGISSTKSV